MTRKQLSLSQLTSGNLRSPEELNCHKQTELIESQFSAVRQWDQSDHHVIARARADDGLGNDDTRFCSGHPRNFWEINETRIKMLINLWSVM